MANSEWRIESESTRYSLFATRYSLLATRYSLLSPASDLAENLGEFFLHLLRQLRARARDHGEVLQSLERPAGIDDGARIGRALLVEQRIERAGPRAAHELDVIDGIAARAHRPHHVEQVGRVDVVIDHDHEAAEIGA